MKASETPLLRFLQAVNQFRIPIYQRTYSWTADQCRQLWEDVIRIARDPNPAGHFVGSIVYVQAGQYHVGVVPELLIIDGQQRLTTVTLLLAAISRRLPESGADMTAQKLLNNYVFNRDETGPTRYKLALTQGDADTLRAILDGAELPDHPSTRVQRNFELLTAWLADSPLSPGDVFTGLQRLMVVDISLDRTQDNPQLIFESLNSTGLALTQADLIRNFVLMGLEPDHQDRLYSDRWYPMEQAFGDEGYSVHFDRFVRDFLTLKSGRIPNIDRIYVAFKEHARTRGGTVDELVAELQRFARFYVAFALDREQDKTMRAAYGDLAALRVDVASPFLLHLADLRHRGIIDTSAHARGVRTVESYVLRRLICGIPTNTLGKTFAGLPALVGEPDPVEALEAHLLLKDSYRRFPDDGEFRRELMAKDIYNLRNRNYILRKLENHRRKEPVVVEDYTIEHVMPQNPDLSPEWQEELGPQWKEVQARYLHTIGNLTLTGYNGELSDRPFSEKRSMEGGFHDSPLRLNHDLARCERWSEAEIVDRATRLAELATSVWPHPKVPAQVIERYRPEPPSRETYSLADHPYLAGATLTLFEDLRRRVRNIDSSVTEEIRKLYIAFKSPSNFLDVIPQKDKLKLSIDIRLDALDDPRQWGRDVSSVGRWGNGDVEFVIADHHDLDYAMHLITQAYESQSTDEPF